MFPVCQDTELGDPAPFSIVARTQIPLLPAWAITMHKLQGMTLERAVVNMDSVFEAQMPYVALSRVRSLEGLKVISRRSLAVLQKQGKLGGYPRVVRQFMEGVPAVMLLRQEGRKELVDEWKEEEDWIHKSTTEGVSKVGREEGD